MDPLLLFGVGTALVGCGAFGTTIAAIREILSVPTSVESIGVSPLLAAIGFIILVDVGIVTGGLWVAIAVAGGASV